MMKVVANVLDGIDSILSFVNPGEILAKGLTGLATNIAKPRLYAGIAEITGATIGGIISTVDDRGSNFFYYDNQNAQTDNYTSQQAYNTCVQEYERPGLC